MKLLIKILISSAMLALAMRLVDLNELKHSLLSIPVPTLAMVVVIFFFGQLLSSYKWWLLARSGSIEAPWLLAAEVNVVALEPVVVARKPLAGTVAATVLDPRARGGGSAVARALPGPAGLAPRPRLVRLHE